MGKMVILFWIRTAVASTPQCRLAETPQKTFKDGYSCMVYGYEHSTALIKKFGPEDVNKFTLYTKFYCMRETPEKNI